MASRFYFGRTIRLSCLSLALAAATITTSTVSDCYAAGAANTKSKGSSSAPTTSTAPASSLRLYGQVNELLSACVNAGVVISSTTLPARVEKVRLGSPAFYGGLQENDVIIKGSLNNNRLQITFKRGVSVYGLDLATEASADKPATALKGNTSEVKTTLGSGTENSTIPGGIDKDKTKDPAWKKLQKYNIVMLIDQSGSMAEAVDGSGLSKWDWCKNQLSAFASQAMVNTGRRFTIVTFNGEYQMRKDCSAQEVETTFTNNHPVGATDLATPLDAVISDYFNHSQTNPLLVVVLTDGMPARPDFVEKTIIDTTNKMNSGEQVKIVFFEIGNDAEGRALIRLLDVGLTAEGARYDIVDANTFERLQQVGLKQALYDTFNQNFQTSLRVAPGASLQSELEIVRKQLQDARARNAQTPSTR